MGAKQAHFDADNYLIYRLLWEKTEKEGAINGFAHAVFPYGSFIAPHDGLAVVLPHDLLHFLEVLQFDRNGYEIWYDLLNLGYKITPPLALIIHVEANSYPGMSVSILKLMENLLTRVDRKRPKRTDLRHDRSDAGVLCKWVRGWRRDHLKG